MLFIIILGAMVAGFVQGLSGFAFGMVAMSFWAWAIAPQQVAAMTVFGALSGQILAAVSIRRKFHFNILWPFLIGGLCGVPLGVMILPYLNINNFKALIGGILLVWCSLMLITNQLPQIKRGGRAADMMIGCLGGMLSGIGGAAGLVPTLWCILRGFERDTQRAVIQNFNLSMLAITFLSYIEAGVVSAKMTPIFLVIGGSMLIPLYIGHRLYKRVSDAHFRRLVLLLLSLSGLALLGSSLLSRV